MRLEETDLLANRATSSILSEPQYRIAEDNGMEEGDDLDLAYDDDDEEGSDNDEWDVCAVPKIFTTEGARRVFVIENTLRVGGNHRPSFEYFGYVVEVPTSVPPHEDLKPLARAHDARVETNLTLSLRYEPPSPKFKRQCPQFASYRLKVSRGNDFVYSTRGMDRQLQCYRSSLVAVWGPLQLSFLQPDDLSVFLAALKYVEVADQSESLPLPSIRESSPADTSQTPAPHPKREPTPAPSHSHNLLPWVGGAVAVAGLAYITAVVIIPRLKK